MNRRLAFAGILLLALQAGVVTADQRQGGEFRGAPPTQPTPPPERQPRPADFRDPSRGSLSPEDRKQLRRDISDHGRDVYRDRR